MTSPEMYSFVIIGNILLTAGPSKQLLRTMASLLVLNEPSTSSGGDPVVEKVSAPGKRLVFRLILKIRAPNGGAVTKAKQMLSLMNLEELWTYPTYSAGLTGTLSVWSSKVVLDLSYVRLYGLPATWLQISGTPI